MMMMMMMISEIQLAILLSFGPAVHLTRQYNYFIIIIIIIQHLYSAIMSYADTEALYKCGRPSWKIL